MTDNDREFIGYAIAECASKGISVHFEAKKFVNADNTRCSGYFDEDGKVLMVASRKAQRDFLPVFVHEFCHFQQWIEKDPIFMNASENTELDQDMWVWLDGKDIPKTRVNRSLKAYQKLELDCEKRVVQHIKDFGLSIIEDEYIKMANVYVLFYSLLSKTRKWYVKPPYHSSKLLKIIPDKFITSFRLPDGFAEIAMDECY